jgi:hypothetical protein
MSLQLAAASYIYIHYALKKRKKQQRWWWQTQLYTNRDVYSDSSLLRDLIGRLNELSTQILDDCELISNTIPKFQQVWYVRVRVCVCVYI